MKEQTFEVTTFMHNRAEYAPVANMAIVDLYRRNLLIGIKVYKRPTTKEEYMKLMERIKYDWGCYAFADCLV